MSAEVEVHMFCIPGGHPGPRVMQRSDGSVSPKPDWRLLPARFDRASNQWVFNRDSPAKVWVCPDCRLEGEPVVYLGGRPDEN